MFVVCVKVGGGGGGPSCSLGGSLSQTEDFVCERRNQDVVICSGGSVFT